MGDLSKHFDSKEFCCECCGKYKPISKTLIAMLEQLYDYMNASAIIISSGYRCENNPWGFKTDAHRKCIAADLCVKKKDGTCYSSWDVAEAAERIGFKGIGIINNTYIHLDTRGHESYTNSFWFGNEVTGENYSTFQKGTVFNENKNSKADIKGLQAILNNAGAKLVEDGIAGDKTLAAVKKYSVELNDKGNLIKWVQDRLNQLGYNAGFADGFAEQPTMEAIYKWQKDNGLGIGFLGGSDWNVLLKEREV